MPFLRTRRQAPGQSTQDNRPSTPNVFSFFKPSKQQAREAQREGDAARDRRDWRAAARAYRRLIEMRPDAFGIHVQLGHMLKECNDLGGAKAAYQNAYLLNPNDGDLLHWYGNLHLREGDYAAAASMLKRSVELSENPHAARDLAEAMRHAVEDTVRNGRFVGHIDEASGTILEGWAVDPDRPGVPVEVEFVADGNVVGKVVADRHRPDLEGLGGFGFKAQLDLADFEDGERITVRLLGTRDELQGSPVPLRQQPKWDNTPFAIEARYALVKSLVFEPGRELALFVTHSPTGAVKPHVAPHVQALVDEGIAVLLIMAADRPADIPAELQDILAGAIVRENRGLDFACWAHALRLYQQAYGASVLYLLNDSIFGPVDREAFSAMIQQVRSSPADIVGLTQSHEHEWHVQSYFLALKSDALSNLQLHIFFADLRMYDSKDEIIRKYECRLVPMLEAAGCTVEVLFPSHAVANPTLFGWRELLDAGFPYVKLLLLRGHFPKIDISDWHEVLAEHGFDMTLLDATLAAGTEGWEPAGKGHPLLARSPQDAREPLPPLRIAFIGPWNYDNGLGAASRGLIAAIRRCGVQLNLHPVKRPFHIHKPLAPPIDVTDFVGPADVAVIHLNPDSWHLLTAEQRAIIGAAQQRIGYWVWEMDHIPPAWKQEFFSVDRIWAPSSYCAKLFTRESDVPVDVIPHAVPLAETSVPPQERAALLERLGLPAKCRIILYAFDGSSYLVRKNPAALVRAFAASGLARRGWVLVLKTKHLFDRVAEGRGLERLVQETEGAVILNVSLPHGQMAELAMVCDIYASPHCSEGFGLTIAEAMSAAKPVVVTDFGGSTDFVDATCGYPVKAHPWRLEDDFGHYTIGGEWAKIDEPALAQALFTAAAAVERGDTTIPRAARSRAAEKLSYAAIGRLVEASFESALFHQSTEGRRSRPLNSNLELGIELSKIDWGGDLVLVTLQADLAPPPSLSLAGLPDGRDHWVVFAPLGALVAPRFGRLVRDHGRARPDVDIFYADDFALGEDQFGEQLRLKPAFDASLLAAKDYIGAPLIVRGSILHELGGLDQQAGAAALSDLVFRADALGKSIARIPTPLLAWRGKRPHVPREARRQMMQRLPSFAAYEIVDGLMPDTLRLARRFKHNAPEVTVVVPTRRTACPDGNGTYIEHLLEALAKTDWTAGKLNVLIGDDVEGSPGWEARNWPFKLRRVATPRAAGEPFNYSAKMNRLWRMSTTEHVVLMNDDLLPREPGWLQALMTFAVDESTGGVGARLLYEDGTLQHAGVVPMFGSTVHAWLGLPAGRRAYQDWPMVHREWSMVTGAVFATRRALLEQVDGFDERFSVEYNDTDLCLRLRALGYRIVYTPHAEMRHVEKASRGERLPPGADSALFIGRWRSWLQADPAFHPQLRSDRSDIEPVVDRGAWYA